jgi:hypothetical protein
MILFKIFVVWLCLQFFLHTFVTFKLWIDNTLMWIIWSWKEIFVVWWALVAMYYIYQDKSRKKKDIVRYMTIALCILLVYALLDTYFKWIGIVRFLKARKYDFIGFMIFFATYYLCSRIWLQKLETYVPRFTRVMKTLLMRGFVWYMILLIKPGALKLFWYDRLSIEWEVWQRPPAIYRTREFEWLPRNQFIFERPISRWFFLTAFFPLFFVQYLHRKSLKKTWFWWAMYGLNIILTYSRAARWSWVIELAILGIITYRKHIGTFLKKVLIPAIVILAAVTRLAKDHVINRQFSNTGHILLLKQWREYFSQNWLLWMGAWSIWPASHWVGWLNFNPENQFLQIAIEFGIIWFIGWMAIYVRYHLLGYNILIKQRKNKHFLPATWNMIAMSIWILGLSISWLVLHSFTDRMIVYPFMLVFGIIYYIYKHTLHTEKGAK